MHIRLGFLPFSLVLENLILHPILVLLNEIIFNDVRENLWMNVAVKRRQSYIYKWMHKFIRYYNNNKVHSCKKIFGFWVTVSAVPRRKHSPCIGYWWFAFVSSLCPACCWLTYKHYLYLFLSCFHWWVKSVATMKNMLIRSHHILISWYLIFLHVLFCHDKRALYWWSL